MVELVDTYYSRTRQAVPAPPPLTAAIDCEVCVIGGGLAGLATALGLAQRGVQVVLLEANELGWGASGRNGGFVSDGFSLSPLRLAARVGKAHARELHDLTRDACELIRARIAASSAPIKQPVEGSVQLSWFADSGGTQRNAEAVNALFGTELEYWPRERVAEFYRSNRYHDAVFKPSTMQFHALNFVQRMAELASAAGAALYTSSRVTQVVRESEGWRLVTATGTVRAREVVYACSGYIDGLHPQLTRATLPVATYVLLTEPLGERLQQAIRAPFPAGDTRFASNYYRVVDQRRLLWGGRVSMFKPSAQRLQRLMLSDLLGVYPQLAGVRAQVAWGGYMGYARHKMPQIGRLVDGAWYCQGFGGHGMATTTMGGDLVARAIAEDDETYKLFEPFGLDYVGAPFGPAVAQTAYWYYQARDFLQTRGRSTGNDDHKG